MSNDNNDANTTAPSKTDGDNQYEVGYGKPPKNNQFKPGKSGNPKGKKKKPASVAQQIESALSKKVEVREGGKTKRFTLQQIMFKSIANNAAKGDLKAAEFLLKHKINTQAETVEFIDQLQVDAEDQSIIDTFVNQMAFGEEVTEAEPSNGNAKLSELEADNHSEPAQAEPEILPEEINTDGSDDVVEETDAGYQEKDRPVPASALASFESSETRPMITTPDRQNLYTAAIPNPTTPSKDNPVGQLAPSTQSTNKLNRNVTIVRSVGMPDPNKAIPVDTATNAADSEPDEW